MPGCSGKVDRKRHRPMRHRRDRRDAPGIGSNFQSPGQPVPRASPGSGSPRGTGGSARWAGRPQRARLLQIAAEFLQRRKRRSSPNSRALRKLQPGRAGGATAAAGVRPVYHGVVHNANALSQLFAEQRILASPIAKPDVSFTQNSLVSTMPLRVTPLGCWAPTWDLS